MAVIVQGDNNINANDSHALWSDSVGAEVRGKKGGMGVTPLLPPTNLRALYLQHSTQ